MNDMTEKQKCHLTTCKETCDFAPEMTLSCLEAHGQIDAHSETDCCGDKEGSSG